VWFTSCKNLRRRISFAQAQPGAYRTRFLASQAVIDCSRNCEHDPAPVAGFSFLAFDVRRTSALSVPVAPIALRSIPVSALAHARVAPARCRASHTSADSSRTQGPARRVGGVEHGRNHNARCCRINAGGAARRGLVTVRHHPPESGRVERARSGADRAGSRPQREFSADPVPNPPSRKVSSVTTLQLRSRAAPLRDRL
jgi:hypothetical protein